MPEPAASHLRTWRDWFAATRDLIYPPHCLICQGETPPSDPTSTDIVIAGLCPSCIRQIRPRSDIQCQRCGAARAAQAFDPHGRCEHCLESEFHFASVHAIGNYTDQLREAVLRCKYPNEDGLTRALGRLLAHVHRSALTDMQITMIVPIPMHWWRRFRRGTNAADVLARELAVQLNLPLYDHALRRVRLTRPQGDLSVTEREKNLRHAFQLRQTAQFQNARVLLVDDILTTATTLNATSKLILKHGAQSVHAAILARAISH
jgi:ComF family protein